MRDSYHFRKPVASSLALCICVLVAWPAGATVIFQESFEGTDQYSVTGGGAKGEKAFWSVLPTGKLDLGFAPEGVDGSAYFGGRNLDEEFGDPSGKKRKKDENTKREIVFDSVDLSNSMNASVHISLAAPSGRRFCCPVCVCSVNLPQDPEVVSASPSHTPPRPSTESTREQAARQRDDSTRDRRV